MRLTDELIERLKTKAGGWSRNTLLWLGVPCPKGAMSPLKGWKYDLIGKEIDQETYDKAFFSMKKEDDQQLMIEWQKTVSYEGFDRQYRKRR